MAKCPTVRMWSVQQEIFILKAVRRLYRAEDKVKSPQIGEELQEHSRLQLGDDHTPCSKNGALANLPNQLLNRASGQLCCFDRTVYIKEGRVTGDMLDS